VPSRALAPARTVGAIARELARGYKLCRNVSSFKTYATDVLAYRVLRVRAINSYNAARTIVVSGGLTVRYRRNRGDIQGIREVWLEEVYRLPLDIEPEVIIDAGANIGLTSLFFYAKYKPKLVVSVEPEHSNVQLLHANLIENGVPHEIVEAAVTPHDGVVLFSESVDSNLGSIASAGRPCSAISMYSLLERTPASRADLLKVDIEGAEQALLSTNNGWLERIGALIIEFHPNSVDYPGLVALLQSVGFTYFPPFQGTSRPGWNGSTDFFLRADWNFKREACRGELR
jgi:FkbM family methyltransferase